MLAGVGSELQLDEDFPRVRPPLEGRLVRLRPVEPEDASRLNPMFNDPDVLAGLTVPMPQPEAGFHEWSETARGNRNELDLVIETLEREAIGGCALRGLNDRNRTADLGIWIGRAFWDRGYGTDAVRTLCRFGFRHMNLQRVDLHVFANNPGARRSYEKVGFHLEGTLRRAQFVGGQYVDELVMGLLAEELVEE
jgi:RimJ/RimL family protein N-acetyltransferase